MTKNLYIFLFALIFCCNSNKKNDKKNIEAKVANSLKDVENSSDSLSINLDSVKSEFPKPETITVTDDPVFHKLKTFQAIPLINILEKFTKIKSLDPKQTQIVFECEDGYNPSMSLELALSRKSYLAISDDEAPKGQDWVDAIKGKTVKKIAPFYVIYSDVSSEERQFKWPYNLVKISLVESAKEFAAVYPKDDDTMVKGFGVFQKNCMICHSLNKVGGKMGPELNYPINITEYWKSDEDLKAFIKKPTSYRNDCKMPAITYLTDKELDEMLRYLHYMVKQKIV